MPWAVGRRRPRRNELNPACMQDPHALLRVTSMGLLCPARSFSVRGRSTPRCTRPACGAGCAQLDRSAPDDTRLPTCCTRAGTPTRLVCPRTVYVAVGHARHGHVSCLGPSGQRASTLRPRIMLLFRRCLHTPTLASFCATDRGRPHRRRRRARPCIATSACSRSFSLLFVSGMALASRSHSVTCSFHFPSAWHWQSLDRRTFRRVVHLPRRLDVF